MWAWPSSRCRPAVTAAADAALAAPIPILRSFSEAEARDFYLRYLGFSVVFEHRFEPDLPLYMEIRRGACVLHVSEHHGDAAPGTSLRITVDDVDAFLRDLNGRGHPRLRPAIVHQPWGVREVSLSDPSGNRLVFCQDDDAGAAG